MDSLVTPDSRSIKQSTLSQREGVEPDSLTKRLKEPLMSGKGEFPSTLKNRLTIQEKEAPVAPRE
jgi:hypothetical protein